MIVRRGVNNKIVGLLLVLALAGVGAGGYYFSQNHSAVNIPQAVIDKTLFPIYIPKQLPSGFALDSSSVANNEGVLVFQLKHTDGRVIAVSEQAIPADFNFTDFYEKQMKGARTMSGTPHHSVIGEMAVERGQGPKFLSIRTGETWVMVSGENIRDDELELIAKQITKL